MQRDQAIRLINDVMHDALIYYSQEPDRFACIAGALAAVIVDALQRQHDPHIGLHLNYLIKQFKNNRLTSESFASISLDVNETGDCYYGA